MRRFSSADGKKVAGYSWSLRREGVALRNEIITTDQYQVWKSRFELWTGKLLGEAEIVSINLRNYLEVFDQCKQPILGAGVNPEHMQDLRILSEILARLQTYLEKGL